MRTAWKIPQILAACALAGMIPTLLAPGRIFAQGNDAKKKARPSEAQSSLDDYLKRNHEIAAEEGRTTGSLWSPQARMSNTASDYKARRTGDLLIIRVVDNFSATANGTAQSQRAYSASSSLSSFMGKIPSTSLWQNLFSPTSAEALNGKGQSALASTLSLSLTGQVVEALPNGVLVVEAVRDITVGNDRQTIILRGLVRPGDVASDGSVLSTHIANLEAEIHGKGLVADATRRPNVLVRTMLKVLNF
ncbi:MAG: flagellar basal body L-ring protein FlgH [Acidobacteriia bacterium]|nr:flagellar basal body L-ring protein FlgH [Terriglobia bacterium]